MTTRRDRRAPHRPATALAALAGLVLLAVVTGCAKHTGGSADPKASQGLSSVDNPTPDNTPQATTGTATPGATTSAAPGKTPTPARSGGLTAVIIAFKVTQQPLCAIIGTSAAPYHRDAQDIILSWQVTGATGVELYVDGGLYGSYDPTGKQQLYFACTTKPKQSHTYKLVTKGGAGTATKTLTVTTDNNPPA